MTRVVRLLAALAAWSLALAATASAEQLNTIFRVAGTTQGLSGDGGPALGAQLRFPGAVAPTADGGLLIADTANHRIRRVSPAGTIATVAGTTSGYSGDGGPAAAAQLNSPSGVAPTADGGYLIADTANNRVRRVAPDGTITTVAGGGSGLGDGGPATAAGLGAPAAVAPMPDGGFLIADTANHRIRRVSPAGTITTVAGTTQGLAGDGGPAAAAQLDAPSGVATTADGGFLIADTVNNRVRRVSPAGGITTVAGTTMGFSGDGGPATAAQLNQPAAVALAPDGSFLVAELGNHRIRRVTPSGTITTVAGTGTFGPAGDGGPATAAQLSFPSGVATTAGGDVLVADQGNHRIRFVDAGLGGGPGPQGAPGPQGPGGAAGLAGPAGPAGALGERDLLALALDLTRYRARPSARVRVRYAATVAGRAELVVRRGRRTAARATGSARGGRNVIAIKAPRAAGSYRLTLTVTADGQRTAAGATLVVRKARR